MIGLRTLAIIGRSDLQSSKNWPVEKEFSFTYFVNYIPFSGDGV
jgi:hypothetical protein